MTLQELNIEVKEAHVKYPTRAKAINEIYILPKIAIIKNTIVPRL